MLLRSDKVKLRGRLGVDWDKPDWYYVRDAFCEVDSETGCWLWLRGKCDGYGRVSWGGGHLLVHRLSLEWKLGRSLLAGMETCHLDVCRGRRHCINPEHLREGTRRSNNADTVRLGRHRAGTGWPSPFRGDGLAVLDVFLSEAGGESNASIARRHGVCDTAVWSLLNGRSWSKRTVELRSLRALRLAACA